LGNSIVKKLSLFTDRLQTAKDTIISPAPISIVASPDDAQPFFELSEPLKIPWDIWKGIPDSGEFPIEVTVSLISQNEKIEFDVSVIYDEA